jgi:HPt (histidine-containing phosphotransfer) domain-containing protein
MKTEPNDNMLAVCNFNYLSELMGGKTLLMKKLMDAFLIQAKEELTSINNAILKKDYTTIKNLAHTMRSSVSIMGIAVLQPILQEMEDLGKKETSFERIMVLNKQLHLICTQAFEEIKKYTPSLEKSSTNN